MNRTARRSNAVLLAPLYLLACVAPALTPPTAYADELDWERVAAVRVIEVVTTDEDGDDRPWKIHQRGSGPMTGRSKLPISHK